MAEPKQTATGTGCLIFIVIAVALFFVVGLVGGANEDATYGGDSGYDDIDARIGCERLVKDNLKSPGTAKFPGPFSGDYAEVRDNGLGWLYSSYVDSQNGFGAIIRTRFSCEVTKAGIVSVDFD